MNGENVNDDSALEPFTNDSHNHDSENGSADSSENYEPPVNQLNVTKFNLDKIATNKHFTIKNKDDKWILIQMNTFTNWINEQLKYEDEKIVDLKFDLKSGVKLIKLVNVLQQDSKLIKRYFKKPLNQHQELENINLALNAITEDGIKLVNIGNFDIQNGNLKLILGLIWHLILRYQIGKTKIPPKKLLLAWIRSVLPQIQINNLTSDLNDGIVIAGLVNYCNPDLLTDWQHWKKHMKLENCSQAMVTAFEHLRIPLVVTPENMSSYELDELSAITYLSYFVREGSPGYKTTLTWIQKQLTDEQIDNFSTDWSDGYLLCKLVQKMGINIPQFPNLDRTKREYNCQMGIDGCKKLKIEPYLSAKELSSPNVETLSVMATLIQFKYLKPQKDKAKIYLDEYNREGFVGKSCEFTIEFDESQVKNIKGLVKGPKSYPAVGSEKRGVGFIKCHFIPGETGLFEVNVMCDDNLLTQNPPTVFIKADTGKIQLVANQKFAHVNQPFELCINPMGAGKSDVEVILTTPSNQEYPCRIEERDSKYFAKIITNEVGEWSARVFYDHAELKESPFKFQALDLNRAQISGENLSKHVHQPNHEINFQVDLSKCGPGKLSVKFLNDKQKECKFDMIQTDLSNVYEIVFNPIEPGQYRCLLMVNEKHIKGSPIDFNVAYDTSKITVDTQNLKSALVDQPCSFAIENHDKSSHGDIKIVITNPKGGRTPSKITINSNNSWNVEFNPTEIGEYYVDVFFANQLVQGSPFKCNVFDPAKIKVTPTLNGIVDQVVKFEVDASQAGTGQLEIAVENGRIPCNFTNQGNLRFIPSFTPREAGKHEITVKFNSYEVPGSPFMCDVIDVNKVALINYDQNETLMFPVFRSNSLELNSNNLSSSSINIKLTSPSGMQVPVSRSITAHNTLKITFQPNEIGTHRLEIDYAGVPITGSPFDIKTYDSSRIVVSEIKGGDVNKNCEFTIDASSAGEGQLEIAVNDGQIKNNVRQIRPGHYSVTFLPLKQDNYVVDVKFNQEVVPGCPKRIFIFDRQNVKLVGSFTETTLIGKQSSFQLSGVHNIEDLKVRIKGPNGLEFVPKIQKIGSEECRIEWTPNELGTYTVYATYSDNVIKGAPFKIKTYDPKRVFVYNVNDGYVFKPNIFCVDASGAGEGSLEIGINCNGHYIPNQVKPLGNSKFEVHFLPQEPLTHFANISFNSEPIKGSPFPINIADTNSVTAQGKGLGLIPVNIPTSFQVLASNTGASNINVHLFGPKGENVPARLYQQSNGDYVCEFTPTSVGQYRVDILYLNQPIAGSPYFASVYDPRAFEIISMPNEFFAGQENAIEVDFSKMGNVEFDAKVTSPSGSYVPIQFDGHLQKRIRIIPSELGPHKVVMFIGQNMIGKPLIINAIEARLPLARGDGLYHGIEDRPAMFYVDSQGMKGNLEVSIEGPQHYTKNQIERLTDGSFIVRYTPVEVGLFKIFAKWNGREIEGSPFISYVVNPDKVKIVGGWQSILDYNNILNLKLYEEKIINFDTIEAGPGTLNATIIAPNGSKLPLRLISQGHIYSLCFTALYDGEYKIHLAWDNHVLPNTPIVARTAHLSDVNKIEVNGLGLQEAKINQESDFIIDGSRAGDLVGLPEIRLTGTKCDIDVRMMQLGHNIYRCTYVAQIPGAYLLSIKWNDRQIGDSPFKVLIGMNSDPSKVIVSGEGIKSGIFGQEIKAFIDTRRAGPGELTAHCLGSQKVAFCEFYDHKDGTFTLFIKPQEPGKHVLHIKYNDEHVPGSPFITRISGPPDASKVRVIGPGICHGVLSKFKSRFVCETKGAGAGQLTVRIRGPKGAFRVEMQRESQKDRTILCKYDPSECGDYQINVKWSGQHVPGSPFNVHVFPNDEELEQFLRVNPEAAHNIKQHQLQYQQMNI